MMPPYNPMPQGGNFGKPQQGGFGQPPMRQPLPMPPQMGQPNPNGPTTPPVYGGGMPQKDFTPYPTRSDGIPDPFRQPLPMTQPYVPGVRQIGAPYSTNPYSTDPIRPWMVQQPPMTEPFNPYGASTGVYNQPINPNLGPNGGAQLQEPSPLPLGWTPQDLYQQILAARGGRQPMPQTLPTMPTQMPQTLPTMPTQMPQTLPTMPTQMPQTLPTMPTMLPTFPQQYNGPGKQGGLSQVQQGGPRRPLPYPPVMG